MKEIITGEIKGLKPGEKAELERIAQRRSRPQDLIDPELVRRSAQLCDRLGAQLGLLIGRDGRVVSVVVGTKDRLYLPDLGRFRLDSARLRALRLVVFIPDVKPRLQELPRELTPLRPERERAKMRAGQTVSAFPFPQDFIADLEKLRLDAVMLVGVFAEGRPGPISLAYLELRELSRGGYERKVRFHFGRDLSDLEVNFQDFVVELEGQFVSAAPVSNEVSSGKALLVGAYTGPLAEAQASMDELQELARTAGVGILDVVIQRRKTLDPRTVIGKGKLEDLVLRSLDLGADLLIFDRELSPSQLRTITNLTELKVLDRSMLILDIFAQRAKSREGRLQVELAQLKYSLPRLTEKDSGLSRLTGGIGGRGPGETKLEISRRRVRDRIADLESKIEKVADERQLRRSRRQSRGVPVVAIVGYTNAGKSTLLNTVTKSDVLSEHKLFATLDPSSRRMRFPNEKKVVFVDTVGFIRELPKELLNAFRATLEEVGEADLLLHIVDATSRELVNQIQVVNETLSGLGFGEKPKILVLNKCDLLSAPEIGSLVNLVSSEFSAFEKVLHVSAVSRDGIEEMLLEVQERLMEYFTGQDPGRFLEIGSAP
jgi:GTP-binding protein HflX